jgi:hypothetical protein
VEGLIGLAVLGAISLVKMPIAIWQSKSTASGIRASSGCRRRSSRTFAATPVDAACADALAAAILKAVRAKQAPSRIYLGLSGRWVL